MQVVPVKVETVFTATKTLFGGKEVKEQFSVPGAGQDTIANARKHYPGYRLRFDGFFLVDGENRRFKPADLTTEVDRISNRN